jgi:hypothetical protein
MRLCGRRSSAGGRRARSASSQAPLRCWPRSCSTSCGSGHRLRRCRSSGSTGSDSRTSPSWSRSRAPCAVLFPHPVHAERPRLLADPDRARLPAVLLRRRRQRRHLATATLARGNEARDRRRCHRRCGRALLAVAHPARRLVLGRPASGHARRRAAHRASRARPCAGRPTYARGWVGDPDDDYHAESARDSVRGPVRGHVCSRRGTVSNTCGRAEAAWHSSRLPAVDRVTAGPRRAMGVHSPR